MIPNREPPRLREPQKWSPEFNDFIARCLVKDPNERASGEELLEVRAMDTVQVKCAWLVCVSSREAAHPTPHTVAKPPVKPVVLPQSATPSQRPASPEAYAPSKPRLPVQPVTGGNGMGR